MKNDILSKIDRKIEETTALERCEQRHLEMFGLLWDLRHKSYLPGRLAKKYLPHRLPPDPIMEAVKPLAKHIIKKVERASYQPKYLGYREEPQEPQMSDRVFERQFHVKAAKLARLHQGTATIAGVQFTTYTDRSGKSFVKGSDYQAAKRKLNPEIGVISTSDVLSLADIEFMLKN